MRFTFILLLLVSPFLLKSQSCDIDFEDFEGTSNTNPPTGWQRINSYIGTTVPYSGTTHAGFNTDEDIFIIEPVDCPSQICFYWRTSGTSSSFDINIDWSDDNEATWNTVRTIRVQDTLNRTTYRQTCVDLPMASFNPSTDIKIRFRQYNRTGGTWYLDDVCISSGGATQLSFTNQPAGCSLINTDFSTIVCAVDDCGNIDNTYISNITLSKNTGSGTLSGTLTQTAVSGCATFSDLEVDAADSYTLVSSDGSLINDTTSSIEFKSTCPTVDTLTVVSYNLLNFPDGRDDCGTNTTITNRVDTLKKIMKYLNPDILMVCEMNNSSGADLILNSALNVDGVTKYARATFVANQSSGASGLDNMFYYNTEKVTLYSQDEVLTDLRDIGEYIVYGNDPNLTTNQDTTFIDFYEGHLKAGSAAMDPNNPIRRGIEADSMRNHIDAKPAGRNNIFGGDFNFYTDTEAAYQTLCYSGTYPFNDPVNREGAWSANSAFADVHTQSTRFSESIECGATGGVDDRFDFILVSDSVLTGGDRVKYISNTYTALGNNGSTYNDEINNVGNTSIVPDSILTALYYMSDHLPVTMKLEITYPTSTLPIDTSEETGSFNNKIDGINFEIYPNPAYDELSIEISEKLYSKSYYITLTNLLGEIVKEKTLDDNITIVNFSDLKEGMYFVNLQDELRTISTKKLIVK